MTAVALRKESVDRNFDANCLYVLKCLSLSARRAWIEIDWASVITAMTSVALRKESVDRNGKITSVLSGLKMSLSARRAWIEMIPLQ